MDADKRIKQYIALRDKVKEIKDRHKAELEKYDQAMTMIEGEFLNHLNTTGSDNVGTASGTAFRKLVFSATVEDGEMFRDHVIKSKNYGLSDWRPNKVAVAAFMENNSGQLPPGVKVTSLYEVQIRRKS